MEQNNINDILGIETSQGQSNLAAISESIKVFLDIEYNTRKASEK